MFDFCRPFDYHSKNENYVSGAFVSRESILFSCYFWSDLAFHAHHQNLEQDLCHMAHENNSAMEFTFSSSQLLWQDDEYPFS